MWDLERGISPDPTSFEKKSSLKPWKKICIMHATMYSMHFKKKKPVGFEVWNNKKKKWQRSCRLVFEVVVEYQGKKTLGTFYWLSKIEAVNAVLCDMNNTCLHLTTLFKARFAFVNDNVTWFACDVATLPNSCIYMAIWICNNCKLYSSFFF